MKEVLLIEPSDFTQLMEKVDLMIGKLNALNIDGNTSKQVYTVMDACELLKVSKRTLQKYRDEGMLSFSQIGDKIYFKFSDIQTFLNKNRVEAF